MAYGSVDSAFVIFPAGPADAEALARVHVQSWRETYRGLLPDAYLARMSEAAHARRFAHALTRPGPDDVTLAVADRWGLAGYAQGGPSRRGVPGEAEVATLYLVRGARSLVISVLRDNFAARGFYEHLGGEAEPARMEPGPGGGSYWEVAYRWADITRLTG
jgi:hypothetical protein